MMNQFRFSYRGLVPHKFMPMLGVHNRLKPTVTPLACPRLSGGVRAHMKLCPASQASTDDLRFMVRSVSVSKIYYVSTGRNAWWSTWATRYSPGCFHTTLASAKWFCESKRVQGTVFCIDELPVLAFHAPERALFAIEINTKHFLCKIDQELLTSVTTVFPVSTMTLQQMHYMFKLGSPLWPRVLPRYHGRFKNA